MRTHRKIAAAFMMALLYMTALSASSAFAIVYRQAGYETEGYDESSAWEINSVEVLKYVRNDFNNGTISSLTTKYFRLTQDLDITSDTSWTPIGSSSTPFNGVFDGGGHTIKVLMSTSVSRSGDASTYTGLFGYIEDGTIKNLHVKGKVIGSNYDSWNDAYHYAGGIAAYVKSGTIENCQFDGEVKSSATVRWTILDRTYTYAGGIVGSNGGRITITNCTVGGDDTSTIIKATRTNQGKSYAGGIIGYFYDWNLYNKITYNYSRVTVEADEARNRIYGYRSGTDGTVSNNSDIDPYASEATPPTISTSTLSTGYSGESYYATLSATGDAPITWSLYSGSLPSGLILDSSTGSISGTPTVTGVYTFTVMAANSAGSDTKSFSITLNNRAVAPTISTYSNLGQYTIQDSLSISLSASGTVPITWSVSSGSLPSGLSLTTGGLLYGTITASGTFSFTITASNSAGSDSRTFTMEVLSPYVTIDTTSLPDATATQYYQTWLYALRFGVQPTVLWFVGMVILRSAGWYELQLNRRLHLRHSNFSRDVLNHCYCHERKLQRHKIVQPNSQPSACISSVNHNIITAGRDTQGFILASA